MNNKIMKWIVGILLIIILGLSTILLLNGNGSKKNNKESNSNTLKELPKPEVTGGQRGELGIDKNINESNIDEYLGRDDAVYRDMRMLEDPAVYENIGGDRFLSGYIKGFEVTPLPYIIPVEGLPTEVGSTYTGETLFSYENNTYIPNYKESMSIIEKIFPKDKVIFLMCGGGGYAGMTKNFLVQLGWDENKIYNIGGYWYYEGKNKVEVKKTVNGNVTYDFDNVPYNKIEFDKLTKIDKRVELSSEFYNYDYNKIKSGSAIDKWNKIDVRDGYWPGHEACIYDTDTNCVRERTDAVNDEDRTTAKKMKGDIINNLLKEKKSFVIQVEAGDVCTAYGSAPTTLDRYFYEYLLDKKIYVFNMGLAVLKETDLYKTVKYNPAVIIVKDGEVYKYIDNNMDEFTTLSKDKNAAIKWIEENIVIK